MFGWSINVHDWRARLICFADKKLLKTLAKYEFKVTEVVITDAMVERHLQKILQPARFYVPDLDRLFGRLRLRSTGEGRDRVTALFADIEEIIAENGLDYPRQRHY